MSPDYPLNFAYQTNRAPRKLQQKLKTGAHPMTVAPLVESTYDVNDIVGNIDVFVSPVKHSGT